MLPCWANRMLYSGFLVSKLSANNNFSQHRKTCVYLSSFQNTALYNEVLKNHGNFRTVLREPVSLSSLQAKSSPHSLQSRPPKAGRCFPGRPLLCCHLADAPRHCPCVRCMRRWGVWKAPGSIRASLERAALPLVDKRQRNKHTHTYKRTL